MFTCTEIRL